MGKLGGYKTEWVFSFFRLLITGLGIALFWMERVYWTIPFALFMLLYALIAYRQFSSLIAKRSSRTRRLAQAAIGFDWIAVMWMAAMTGGITSPLAPLVYFVIMHAAFYGGMRGAAATIAGFVAGFAAIGSFQSHLAFAFWLLEIGVMAAVGLLGSFVVVRERKHFYDKTVLGKQVRTDYLTGLYNHRCFHESIGRLVHTKGTRLLVIGDIDHFKLINDQYGHATGDLVLKEVGKIIADCVGREKGRAFRCGGEEFAFLFANADYDGVKRAIETIYQELSSQPIGAGALKVTMSFGVSAQQAGETESEWLERTDHLLYKAKHMGRNRAVFDDQTILVNQAVSMRKESYGAQAKIIG